MDINFFLNFKNNSYKIFAYNKEEIEIIIKCLSIHYNEDNSVLNLQTKLMCEIYPND